jgi:hypothetical protein
MVKHQLEYGQAELVEAPYTHSINHLRSTPILNNSSHCKPECPAASLTDYTQ